MLVSFPHFIIIDDSQLDCFIGEKIIQNTGKFSSIKCFGQATEALEYVKNSETDNSQPVTIIVLDIQMPVMNGFQFVEAFEILPEATRRNFAIFMFSSSINENDKNRIENHSCIRKFYGKPISKDIVAALVEEVSQ